MNREEFDSLVVQLEQKSKEEPGAYRTKVLLLAILGYAYIFLLLAVLLGLTALLVVLAVKGRVRYFSFKAGAGLLALIYIVLRALWVRLPSPQGIVLTRQDAPALFEEIEELRQAARSPKVHQVVLNGEYNASIAQIPRFGFFGGYRNYLTVGLPLMQALSADRFRAVLAHEFGHLSKAHGRIGGWIYRIRQTWYQLMEVLEHERHLGAAVFRRFFNWYVPFFGAYSFVLARAEEYEADRFAARQAGEASAADALINTTVSGAFLQNDFWPTLYKKADTQPQAPESLYTEMAQALRAAPSDQVRQWMQKSLSEKTGSDDTHPSLSDRLAALGQPSRLPALSSETAAARFLGASLERLEHQLSYEWGVGAAESWKERHRYVQESMQKLDELEAKATSGSLTSEEFWQRALWVEEFRGEESARPLYEEIVGREPENALAHYALGRIRLKCGEADGVPLVEKAMSLNAEAVIPGCELVYNYLLERNRPDEAQAYYRRAVKQSELMAQAEAERASLNPKDRLIPHNLTEQDIARLTEQLALYPQIKAANLARKEVRLLLERPLYVLNLVVKYPWYKIHSENAAITFGRELAQTLQLPGETFVLINSKIKRIRKVEGARIYP
ncbi:MAG: M48 family metallopeptidase [Armatimonadetes bacterium]|nr:M48 family metallopeptidase [Armatimonadota bacterium]